MLLPLQEKEVGVEGMREEGGLMAMSGWEVGGEVDRVTVIGLSIIEGGGGEPGEEEEERERVADSQWVARIQILAEEGVVDPMRMPRGKGGRKRKAWWRMTMRGVRRMRAVRAPRRPATSGFKRMALALGGVGGERGVLDCVGRVAVQQSVSVRSRSFVGDLGVWGDLRMFDGFLLEMEMGLGSGVGGGEVGAKDAVPIHKGCGKVDRDEAVVEFVVACRVPGSERECDARVVHDAREAVHAKVGEKAEDVGGEEERD